MKWMRWSCDDVHVQAPLAAAIDYCASRFPPAVQFPVHLEYATLTAFLNQEYWGLQSDSAAACHRLVKILPTLSALAVSRFAT